MQRPHRRRAGRARRTTPTRSRPLVLITTTGDRVQDRRLLEIGGKGLFTKEIEEALLDGRIDCAVHSLKDMPAELPPGLVIGAIPRARGSPRRLHQPQGRHARRRCRKARVLGTASLRRQAQALHQRPDLQLVTLRGNVDTRLAKLEAGEADAILLALAGLNRLGLGHLRDRACSIRSSSRRRRARARSPSRCAPRTPARPGWRRSRHRPSAIAVAAERGALAALEGSCKTAIGAHARIWTAPPAADRRGPDAGRRAALPPRGRDGCRRRGRRGGGARAGPAARRGGARRRRLGAHP